MIQRGVDGFLLVRPELEGNIHFLGLNRFQGNKAAILADTADVTCEPR
jgi:hypothetical protein